MESSTNLSILYVTAATTICERSFSQARLIMINHLRKFMNTRSLSMLIFFKYKVKFWEILTIINDNNISELAQEGIDYDELADEDEEVYSYQCY